MMRRLCTLGFLMAAVTSLAAGPQSWRAATQPEFLKGDLEQISVDEQGRLTLGPSITRVFDAGVPFVWTAVASANGATFLGTGNDGRVFRVDADGRGTVFYDAPELEVHALAVAPDGGLFVGTSPDGRVYKVNAQGVAQPFFDPDEKYIWSLAVDSSGRLIVATGDPKGRVYRVSPTGTAEPLYTATATHIVSLAFDSERRLVLGTESPGRVFRIDADGRPFLLLDTGLQEVRALRADTHGRVYAAAQARRGDGGGSADSITPAQPVALAQPVASVSVSITAMSVVDTSTPPPTTTPGTSGGATVGAIFRIDADGTSDRIWESSDDAPFDLAVLDDGALLVATGNRGKLYRLSGDPLRVTLLGRVPGQQAVQLLRSGGRTLAVTSNSGALLRIDDGHANQGTYTSEVRDAHTSAAWGALSWRATTPAGGRVELSTRSGNSATPDEAWSAWSGAYTTAEGSAITSPAARYLQWRVVLAAKADSPVVTSVAAAYMQRNQRPVVSGLIVHPPGVVFQKPFPTGETEIAGYRAEVVEKRLSNQGQPPPSTGAPALGRRTYQQGLQTIVWKGDDANGDDLTFDVSFRREGDATWTVLATKLTDAIYVWDTTSVPSGHYVLKVTASDDASQPAGAALRGDVESSVVEVDSLPPAVTLRSGPRVGGRLAVAVEARDANSAVARVEYSLDGGPWTAAYPADGMLDSQVETLALTFPAADAGKTLVVRAADALHNVGTADIVLK
ncbi:MAG: hypothetical protein ABI880_00825 [Acidobacteriota bacterium]